MSTLTAQLNAIGVLPAPALDHIAWLAAALSEPAPPGDPADIAEAAGDAGGRYFVYVVEAGAVLWLNWHGKFDRSFLSRQRLSGPEAAVLARNYDGRVIRAM